MQQVTHFVEECEVLSALLEDLGDEEWERPTRFKEWTINDVLIHLHFWNEAADMSVFNADQFAINLKQMQDLGGFSNLRAREHSEVGERGPQLLTVWQSLFRDMGRRWINLDPKKRVKWAGPDMSVRSSISARQMETWAHGQAIFDLLGVERREHDRIRNIVFLGVNAFAWSFIVHGQPVPEVVPYLDLSAPSGAVWTYGDASGDNRISGLAVEFAQVVTQTRNIADTSLVVEGPVATGWMADAQCFAGPPETPPAPGTRVRENAGP